MGGFLGSLFGGGASTPEVIVPSVASPDDAVSKERAKIVAQAEAERIKKRKGAASTIMTAAQGALTPATTLKATLGA